jgi:hypothetical protein
MEVDVQWRSSVYSKDQGSSAVLVTYGAASSVSKSQLGFGYLASVAFMAQLFYCFDDQENSPHPWVVGGKAPSIGVHGKGSAEGDTSVGNKVSAFTSRAET